MQWFIPFLFLFWYVSSLQQEDFGDNRTLSATRKRLQPFLARMSCPSRVRVVCAKRRKLRQGGKIE